MNPREGLRRIFNRGEPQLASKPPVITVPNPYAKENRALLRLTAFARVPGVLNGFEGVQIHESTEGVWMRVDHDHGNKILETGRTQGSKREV